MFMSITVFVLFLTLISAGNLLHRRWNCVEKYLKQKSKCFESKIDDMEDKIHRVQNEQKTCDHLESLIESKLNNRVEDYD